MSIELWQPSSNDIRQWTWVCCVLTLLLIVYAFAQLYQMRNQVVDTSNK